jgi:hypothetical protein
MQTPASYPLLFSLLNKEKNGKAQHIPSETLKQLKKK